MSTSGGIQWDPGAAKKSEALNLGARAKSSARPADAAPTLPLAAAAAATGDGDGRVIHSLGHVGNHGCLKLTIFNHFLGMVDICFFFLKHRG